MPVIGTHPKRRKIDCGYLVTTSTACSLGRFDLEDERSISKLAKIRWRTAMYAPTER